MQQKKDSAIGIAGINESQTYITIFNFEEYF